MRVWPRVKMSTTVDKLPVEKRLNDIEQMLKRPLEDADRRDLVREYLTLTDDPDLKIEAKP